MIFKHCISFLTLLGLALSLKAQMLPEYTMQNLVVSDCDGILKDSEALLGGTTYGHNENYTFTICSGGRISMTFNSIFRTESGIDTIRFFDGQDTLAPQIGATHSGTTPPPTVIANSGCLTVNFKSDNSVAYAGWEATWNTENVEPIPPTLTVNPVPNCNAVSIGVYFDKNVDCSSLTPNDFTIYGPQAITVTSVTSAQCVNPGDSTIYVNLGLSSSITSNCDYAVELDLGILDNCDSTWYFTLIDSFVVNTCPFDVEIVATEDTICPGSCTQLEAIVTGNPGSCLSFTYNWNNGLPPTPGPHLVCPGTNTTYSVSVQLSGGGPIETDSKTIYHVDPKITTPDSTEICQSDSAIILTVTPPGGVFTGNGIINGNTGIFDPNVAGGGIHKIYYSLTFQCLDSIEIIVLPIDAGLDQAACPGVAPFQVTGFPTTGGFWSGDSITPAGIFNPALPGSYTVTYNVNGCVDSKVINVDTIILNTPIDTVCETDDTVHLSITPFGGIWSGPGIIDTINGIFDPYQAGAGAKTIIYSLSGCEFRVNVFVKEIYAGPNRTNCPQVGPYLLYPARPPGGTWSGVGIINPVTGLYDPSVQHNGQNGNDTLTYTAPNGCSDEKVVILRNTQILKDTVYMCIDDSSMILNWQTVQRTPGGGVWSGFGVQQQVSSGHYYFNPGVAGIGAHRLRYVRHTCPDSMVVIVHPDRLTALDTIVCSTHPPFLLQTMPYGGYWTGSGVDPATGMYDPSNASFGTNIIEFVSPTNCVKDSVFITVYPYEPASISGIDSILCFSDSTIRLTLRPENGILAGPGIDDSALTFNPSLAGEGLHEITYEFGKGICKTSTTMNIRVLPELETQVDISDDELCLGESATITINPKGGPPNPKYAYMWSEGLFPQQSNVVVPLTTTTYIIKTTDGCSDPVIDSVTIKIAEDFKIQVEAGDKKCLGDNNYASINIVGSSEYEYLWEGPRTYRTDSINAMAGEFFNVTITDKETGCKKDTSIKIPGYPNVKANFIVNPNLECIPSDRKNVNFIDLSSNATTGVWDFGTGDSVSYVYGENPNYEFQESGYYVVKLIVQNEGGCEDEFERTICVKDIRPVFVADAFTPNGDGVNDVLHVKGEGFNDFWFGIYNKYGRLVFESSNINKGWNGDYNGKPAEAGVYVYVVSVRMINNESSTVKGNVSLIR